LAAGVRRGHYPIPPEGGVERPAGQQEVSCGKGAKLDLRDLDKEPLSVAEWNALMGERDDHLFLNSRNKLYRERKREDDRPSRSEALPMMAADPNLIRRPVVISGRQLVLGLDEKALKESV
jgi:arsenate reductase-like glutaredoxin family protein